MKIECDDCIGGEDNISLTSELKTWSWILKIWIPLYSLLLVIGVFIGTYVGPEFYWSLTIIGVPLVVIPMTYRNLVGGGCSLRFQICALVKGMLAGFVFVSLSIFADTIVWQILSGEIGWNPLITELTQTVYFIWFLSGMIGGFGARIVEVRGETRPANITVAGFK